MSGTESNESLLRQIVLGEVGGKNQAIHAYDAIVWKIRTGYLTLIFAGWAILLQGLTGEHGAQLPTQQSLGWGLYLFSLGFTVGAWYVDRSYIQRKFRVILALDLLTERIVSAAGDCKQMPADLLQVAGDNSGKPYDCPGYRNAMRAERAVYIAPMAVVLIVLVWIV